MGNSLSQLFGKEVPSRQVATKYGVVEGKRIIREGDRQVDAFLGVPFAKPPVGELRFRKPERPEPWDGVKKVNKFGARFIQGDFWFMKYTHGVGKSEDALFLNIFTPVWEQEEFSNKLFPVMVFVHGGGFMMDSAVKYGDIGIATYLVRHGVVVVTIQYRLGPLGFFSTGDEVCPGNLGLWDQAMALQWIQDNITAFNGDKDKVTVFGQSAGGACCDLLSLSPHSRDLFHQVAPLGGNGSCPWAIGGRVKEVSEEWAQKLGFSNGSSEEMMEFLKQKPAEQFEKSLFSKFDPTKSTGLDFAPVIDGDFLPKPVTELRKEAPKKKCMMGIGEYEGLLFVSFGMKYLTMENFDRIINAKIPESVFPDTFEQLREQAKKLYMSSNYADHSDKAMFQRAFIELYGDVFVNNGAYKYGQQMHQAGHDVYMLSFDYVNPMWFGPLLLSAPFRAATHCTELTYMFGVGILFPLLFNHDDHEMIDLWTTLVTNFVKYGDPNGPPGSDEHEKRGFTWEKLDDSDKERYLSVKLKPKMKSSFREEKTKFWFEIAAKIKEHHLKNGNMQKP